MQVNIDLSQLDEAQLMLMQHICPDKVKEEFRRRRAYGSLDEGFPELMQAVVDLRTVVDSIKQTAATKAVKDSRIIEVAERLITTWEVNRGNS